MKTLTHQQAHDSIEKAPTGVLSAAELAALDAHLLACADCRAYQARFRENEAALRLALGREARRVEPDPGAVQRANDRIRVRTRRRRAAVLAARSVRAVGLAGFAVAVAFGLNWVFTSFSQAILQTTPEPGAEASPTVLSSAADPVLPAPAPTGSADSAGETLPVIPTPTPILGYTPFSRQLRLTLGTTGAPVRAVAFSPDGETVAAAYGDGYIRIWRARDGAMLAEMQAHIKEATTLSFSSDGAMLATGGRDGAVKLWLPKSGVFVKTVYTGQDIVEAVQFSPNDELLAVTLDNFSVALVQVRSGNLTEILPGLVRLTVNTDQHRNSTLVVSGESAMWLDAEGERPLGLNVQGQGSRSAGVVLSADGTLLASTATDGRIYLWRIYDITIVEERFDELHLEYDLVSRFISGNLLFTLEGHTGWANEIDFSADGRYLASASEDGTIIIWSLDDGIPVEILTGHDGPVNSLDVSPDDRLIASGSDDGTVRIWLLADNP